MKPRGVMILAYSYPPRGGVGSLRAVRLAKYLGPLGWRVSILTADGGGTSLPSDAEAGLLPGVEVLSAPYIDRPSRLRDWLRVGRRAIGPTHAAAPQDRRRRRPSTLWLAARSLLIFPDDQSGWIAGALATGEARLRRGDIDAVISTSPPESAHVIGARLKSHTGVPWVADFRDPWRFSHLREVSWLDRIHGWAEARTLRCADAVVTVSRGWSERFQALYPQLRHRVIPNGYDSPATTAPPPTNGRFRVVYTGKLDLDQQDPSALFEGLAAAITAGEIPRARVQVVFHCYGHGCPELSDLAARAGIGQVFEDGGPISQEASSAVQASADVLVLIGWHRDPDCVPAKLFDYLAAGRRILVLGSRRGEAARLVSEAGRGVCVSSAEECRSVLSAWFSEWSAAGRLEAGGVPSVVASHAFGERAQLYSTLLDEVIKGVRSC